MSTPDGLRRWRHSLRTRSRDQRGMTLIETMLAVTITTMLALPMLGWATLAFQQQVETQNRNVDGTSLGLLRAYFFSDVASAQAAFVAGDELGSCGRDLAGGPATLVLADGDSRTAYLLGPGDEGTTSFWRVTCPTVGAAASDRVELVEDVLAAGTAASCSPLDNSPATSVLRDADMAPESTGDTMPERGHAAHDNAADIAKENTAGLGRPTGQGVGRDDPAGADSAGDGLQSGLRVNAACSQLTMRVATAEFEQAVLTTSLRVNSAASEILDAPTAAISAEPTSGPRRLTVQFSSAGSTDLRGGELTFSWDFGDGNSSKDPAPVHSFDRVGTHLVGLVVTNDLGVASKATVELEVLDNAPVAVISAPAPGTVTHRGEPVQFSSFGSNDDLDAEWGGRIVSYAWDFGDGTTSTEADPIKVYDQLSPAEGFTVQLVITDDAGQSATAVTNVAVTNRAPKVLIVATPERGTSPLVVTFTALVEDEPGMSTPPPLSYTWDFGDGVTSTDAQPPAITFTGEGVRTVSLTLVDDVGASTVATTTVTVDGTAIGPPTNLRRTNSGNEQGSRFIEMAWDRVEGADRYEVFLQCESCDETASGSESGTTVRIRGLSSGRKDYLASVRARDAATGVWGPVSAQVRVRS